MSTALHKEIKVQSPMWELGNCDQEYLYICVLHAQTPSSPVCAEENTRAHTGTPGLQANCTFRFIQTWFVPLTKESFHFICDKQTTFKGKSSHSYMKYSALEKCSELSKIRNTHDIDTQQNALTNAYVKEKRQ